MELYPLRWLVENELPRRDLVNPYDRGKQEHIFSLLSRRLGCRSESHLSRTVDRNQEKSPLSVFFP